MTGWSQTVVSTAANGLPLQKVFIKSQLDLMTANAWMQGVRQAGVQWLLLLSFVASANLCSSGVAGVC
jgi:hypothetical protein